MKKKFLPIISMVALTIVAYSQKSYLNFSLNYSNSLGGQSVLTQNIPFGIQSISMTSGNIKPLSYGKGIYIGFGYFRDRASQIDWGFDIQYLIGVNTLAYKRKEPSDITTYYGNIYGRGSGFFFIPYIQLGVPVERMNDGFRPFLKLGIISGRPDAFITEESKYDNVNGPNSETFKRIEFRHKFGLGLKSSFGFIKSFDNSCISFELGLSIFRLWKKEAELLEYTYDGRNSIELYPERIVEFEKEVKQGGNLSNKSPFGSFGFTVTYFWQVRNRRKV